MESLCKVQNNLLSNMEKSQINFRKSPKSRLTETYLEARLDSLEKQWSVFNDNHSKIVSLSTGELKSYEYFSSELYEKVEELYLDFKSEIKHNLKKFSAVSKSDVLLQCTDSTESSSVKLPHIAIPKFTGSYNEWLSFRDLFISLIHKNPKLDDVQKLHYLKTHLSGEAEQLLRHISITAQNYHLCWEQLEKRYNNKRYLAEGILKRFMSQRNITVESAAALKELLDTSNECLCALDNLGIKTESWDVIVIYILCLKLDNESRKLWEARVSDSSEEIPSLKCFKEFLELRFRSLEFLDTKGSKINKNPSPKNMHLTKMVESKVQPSCVFCQDNHKISNCKKFSQESVEARREFVQGHRLCYNCLNNSNHTAFSCRLPTRCQICKKRHHSLLHPKGKGPGEEANQNTLASVQSNEPKPSGSNVVACCTNVSNQVLLATALVRLEARNKYKITVRALLDQGSQASFVTEATVQLLGLTKIEAESKILGLCGDQHRSVVSKAVVLLKLQSLHDPSFSIIVKAHVLNKLTSLLPERNVMFVQEWKELEQINLADPQFHTPNKIDLLLGAEVYGHILKDGILRGPPGYPIAQNTKLGWILSGEVEIKDINKTPLYTCCTSLIHEDTNATNLLKKFWELEEESNHKHRKHLTEEEKQCEEVFARTTTRDESGRYVVRLPFRSDDPACQHGNSKEIALRRFKTLEKKLERDKYLQNEYSKVIQEYLDLGHMEIVPDSEEDNPGTVYLPHHAVVREAKDTTRVRVVFDASCIDKNGASLNNDLMVGPTLQADLRTLIMRWRQNPICLVADIEKMYRQVNMSRKDIDFQRVLWRDPANPGAEIKSYRLLTVTFGTASAPYLAVKVLQQTANDEGKISPAASERIINDFYMDDLLSGCQTIEEGKQIHKEINEILRKGGFVLKKWSSNNEELLNEIKEESKAKEKDNLEIKMDKILKILGLTWDRASDGFQYVVQLPTSSGPVTKRKVISEIAKLFDPLGWLAPSIIIAKIFIQRIWLSGIEWDQELSPTLLKEWNSYREELTELMKFKIPRWTHTSDGDVCVQLHGFSDASNQAYAAVIYIRVVDAQGIVHVSLVTSKTKVAPVKQVSIPRLELCGAVLLSRLLKEVSEVLQVPKQNIRAWTDSTVVLAWLSSHPGRWKTFIANRVSEIITEFDRTHWSHVQSKDNPADCASRGVKPAELSELKLWKDGPVWLKQGNIKLDKNESYETKLEEKSKKVYHTAVNEKEEDIFLRFSTLRRLLRVTAFCRRMLPVKDRSKHNWLKAEEIKEALQACVKKYQNEYFSKEIADLSKKKIIEKKSKLTALNPYIDEAGILRVGGRLERAEISENMKHPIILPAKSHLTDLIIADAHEKLLHGGTQLMVNYLRSKYWILDVKNRVKFYVKKCVSCVRYAAQRREQLMGQLPKARVTVHRPFHQSGVDYAGPINIRASKGRGHKSYKGYICLFICMATRAVHLEAVTDLTSQGFLAAFKRFVARRGHCADLYSDNGTNFVGASRELKILFAEERSSVVIEIADWLGTNGTNWHFIPPVSANFGGLWEAGVRSTKHHLRRVIGENTLTFEEMTTLLSQIEACLNSRPMYQLSNNPEDPSALTPGHFLIGEPLVLVPDSNFENSNVSSLTRWHLTQKMLQDFWRRWSQEYLTQLQNRYKWKNATEEPKVGDVVLIREDNLPPSRWIYGIIIKKHPGLDNLTRVVTLRCKNSELKRPTSKIIVLPVST